MRRNISMLRVRLLKRDNERQLEAKSRAALSAKRKQAAASRWNKSAVKEDQRTKAVDKTTGKLDFGGKFEDKLYLVFLGDKGGSSTKCAVGIGNVKQANSSDSLLLVSIFDDDDSHVNLSSLSAVFNQLNFKKINVGQDVKEVKCKVN
uniref:Uncharacterized protein n=1 Tax=Ditylenchus dipsaci TaxID=166011 RepID=A0A915EJG4_9BILA